MSIFRSCVVMAVVLGQVVPAFAEEPGGKPFRSTWWDRPGASQPVAKDPNTPFRSTWWDKPRDSQPSQTQSTQPNTSFKSAWWTENHGAQVARSFEFSPNYDADLVPVPRKDNDPDPLYNLMALYNNRPVPKRGTMPPSGFWDRLEAAGASSDCSSDFELWVGRCQNGYATKYGWGLLRNGDVTGEYVGETQNGKAHGQGSYKTRKATFTGNWVDGKLVTGRVDYASGASFVGSFDCNQPYKGVGTDASGERFAGRFDVGSDGVARPVRDDSLATLIGGTAAVVLIAATGALLVGGAAIAMLQTAPRALVILVI